MGEEVKEESDEAETERSEINMAGQIIKRGERTWLVRVFLGRDAQTGKRQYHNQTVQGTKKGAEDKLVDLLKDRNPAPTVLSEVKLDIEEVPRPEGELPDFKLSSQIRRLMCQLDQFRDGRIEKIVVREGIPRHLVLASLPTSRAAPNTSAR